MIALFEIFKMAAIFKMASNFYDLSITYMQLMYYYDKTDTKCYSYLVLSFLNITDAEFVKSKMAAILKMTA